MKALALGFVLLAVLGYGRPANAITFFLEGRVTSNAQYSDLGNRPTRTANMKSSQLAQGVYGLRRASIVWNQDKPTTLALRDRYNDIVAQTDDYGWFSVIVASDKISEGSTVYFGAEFSFYEFSPPPGQYVPATGFGKISRFRIKDASDVNPRDRIQIPTQCRVSYSDSSGKRYTDGIARCRAFVSSGAAVGDTTNTTETLMVIHNYMVEAIVAVRVEGGVTIDKTIRDVEVKMSETDVCGNGGAFCARDGNIVIPIYTEGKARNSPAVVFHEFGHAIEHKFNGQGGTKKRRGGAIRQPSGVTVCDQVGANGVVWLDYNGCWQYSEPAWTEGWADFISAFVRWKKNTQTGPDVCDGSCPGAPTTAPPTTMLASNRYFSTWQTDRNAADPDVRYVGTPRLLSGVTSTSMTRYDWGTSELQRCAVPTFVDAAVRDEHPGTLRSATARMIPNVASFLWNVYDTYNTCSGDASNIRACAGTVAPQDTLTVSFETMAKAIRGLSASTPTLRQYRERLYNEQVTASSGVSPGVALYRQLENLMAYSCVEKSE
jgi:hypothetical protein